MKRGKVKEVKRLPDLSATNLDDNTRLVKVSGFVQHVASYTDNFRQMDEYSSISQNIPFPTVLRCANLGCSTGTLGTCQTGANSER